jgi:ubiquinone/menaquinone biosynthesis C-methylase UbiE
MQDEHGHAEHERRYAGEVERLRRPERVAWLEVERVVDLVLDGIDARSALDVGIGSGIWAEAFARRGLHVAGVDVNEAMLAAARAHVPAAAELRAAPAERLPFADRSFDVVFLGHLLHEADDAVQVLREARRTARLRVAALEWPYREEEGGPPLAHRLAPETVERLARDAGFAGVATEVLQWMVLYRFVEPQP